MQPQAAESSRMPVVAEHTRNARGLVSPGGAGSFGGLRNGSESFVARRGVVRDVKAAAQRAAVLAEHSDRGCRAAAKMEPLRSPLHGWPPYMPGGDRRSRVRASPWLTGQRGRSPCGDASELPTTLAPDGRPTTALLQEPFRSMLGGLRTGPLDRDLPEHLGEEPDLVRDRPVRTLREGRQLYGGARDRGLRDSILGTRPRAAVAKVVISVEDVASWETALRPGR